MLLLLAACQGEQDLPAPPRSTSGPEFEPRSSSVAVPITLSLDDLQRGLERDTPRHLWSIDERNRRCLGARQARVLGRSVRVAPNVECAIVGSVTRGPVTLSEADGGLVVTLPIRATVSARDAGGLLRNETATASGTIRAVVKPGLDRDWNPDVTLAVSYDWQEPPGIEFLGQRIRFARRGDAGMRRVIAGLERGLEQAMARIPVRPVAAAAWRRAFTTVRLSENDPTAWLRLTPTGMGLTGHSTDGRTLTLTVAARAVTETFVGGQPSPTPATPLPPQIPIEGEPRLDFFVPVLVDYAELEEIVLGELQALAARGIRLAGVGQVSAEFDDVTIHATEGGRLAVGITARVGARGGQARGRVWLTALPVSEAKSPVVGVRDLRIFGRTDRFATNLLIRLAGSPGVRRQIARALTHDFSGDYADVLASANRSIAEREAGPVRFSAHLDAMEHGAVQATGAGLFVPVAVRGTGQITIAPRRSQN